jgi:cytochrome c oxidase assembly factor 2
MTSSLFATTVAASFFVVGLPHILPCPSPRVAFADGEAMVDENGKRRRKRRANPEIKDGIVQFDKSIEEEISESTRRTAKNVCPVPKPGGMLGELLGFHKTKSEDEQSSRRVDR